MKITQKRSAWADQKGVERFFYNDTCSIDLVTMGFRVMGLAPVSAKNLSGLQRNRKISQNLTFKRCMISLLYTYGLIAVVFGITFVTVPLIHSHVTGERSEFLTTFQIVKGVFGIIVILVIWLCVALRYKLAVKILNRIVDIDNEISVLQDLYYLETSKRRISILFAANYILWIVIFVIEVITTEDPWGVLVPLLLPDMIMNGYIMQYILMLIMMENRFMSVNHGFIMISKSRIETFLHSDIRPTDVSERMILNNFVILKRAHSVFCEICRDISDYYAFPILPTIAFQCGAIIYNCYNLLIPVVVQTGEDHTVLEIMNRIVWVFMEILPILALSVCVTRVLNEVGKTGGRVYKVLARSVLNYVAKDELKKFSLELLHKNVQFTAYDIFSLDCTLIQSIFGMLATYLIILVQFQLNHQQQEDKKIMTTASMPDDLSTTTIVP